MKIIICNRHLVKYIGIILLLYATNIFSFSENAGTSSAEFLKIQHDARATALGCATTPLVDDVDSLFWNPSSLNIIRSKELTATYLRWLGGANSGTLGIVYPFRRIGTFGLGIKFFSLSDIPHTTTDHRAVDTFSNTDLCLVVGFGKKIPYKYLRKLHIGTTLNFIRESFYENSRISLGLNLGIYYNTLYKNFDIAFVIKNIGFSTAVKEESDPLPLTFGIGASYQFYIDDLLIKLFKHEVIHSGKEDFLFLLNLEKSRDEGIIINSGVEIAIKDLFFIRTGYQIGTDLAGFTLGCGVRYKSYKLDYAFVPYSIVGNTHRFTFNMAWGKGRDIYKPYVKALSEPFYSTKIGKPYLIKLNIKDESPLKEWIVVILRGKSEVVRVYRGEVSAPDKIEWDGKDNNGKVVEDGVYNYIVRAIDIDGNQTELPLFQFVIDSIPPSLNSTLNKETIKRKEDGDWEDIVIDFNTEEKVLKYYKVNIYKGEGIKEENLINTLFALKVSPQPVVWNGKDKEGNNVESGIYTLEIIIADMAGNEIEEIKKVKLE